MPARTANSEARLHKPIYAPEVKRIHDWIARATKYLNDTGNGSLQALFATLELSNQSNITAALNLLGCNIKGQVVKNTKIIAEKLLKTKQAADREQKIKTADAHQQALQPKSDRSGSPEYVMSLHIAIVAFQAVMMREQAHSNEFGSLMGQHNMDLGVLICIMFEAFLDYRERAHKGYFVNKLFPRLPSNRSNPSSPSPIADIELPFTPEVVFQLTEKASRIEMALRYLGDLRLFSGICLLDLSSSSVQKTVAALLGSKHYAVCKQVRNLTAVANKHLKALNRVESELAQGRSLHSCLIRLAVDLVADRMRKFPKEFEDDGMISSNLRVVFGITFEALIAHNEEGSYFHRKLAEASKRAINSNHTVTSKTPVTSQSAATFKSTTVSKRITTSKRAATSKRTIAQTNTDSNRDESSNVDPESQWAKRRRKKASKKHDNNVLAETQEPAGNNTPEARDTHLFEDDSDAESSLFIPQTGSPVATSADRFFEEYSNAADKGQTEKYLVLSKGSEILSTSRPSSNNIPGPQKQPSSPLPKAKGGHHFPVRSNGKNGRDRRRKPRR